MANRISYQKMSPNEQREFNRWLKANTILGSILAIGMLAMALAGSAVQPDETTEFSSVSAGVGVPPP
jgi:hypothetical protein